MTFSRLFVTACLLAGSLHSFSASAAAVGYDIQLSNTLPGDDYLRVVINDSGGDINFTVSVYGDAFDTAGASNFGMQNFSFNADDSLSVSAANISGLDPASWGVRSNKNAGGGFGKFDFQLTGTGGARTDVLSFSITGVDGDDIFSYALAGGGSEFFASHVAGFNLTDGVTSAQFAGSEFAFYNPVGSGPPVPEVPVPAAAWLFMSALAGLAGLKSKKRS